MITGLVTRTLASEVVAILSRQSPTDLEPAPRSEALATSQVDRPPPEHEPTMTTSADLPPPRPPSRLRRLLRGLVDVTLVLALGITVFVAYGLVGNRWYHVVAVVGGSMEPTITRGDLIVVTPAPATIRTGMILVMGIDGRIVTHRVVDVRPDGSLVTKGDANPTVDDWQGKPITIFGQYAFSIPALGRFLPISNASGASFTDQERATQRIEVGRWIIAPPDPALAPPPAGAPSPSPAVSVSPSPSPPAGEQSPSPGETETPSATPAPTVTPSPPTVEPSPTIEPPPTAEPPAPTPEPPAPTPEPLAPTPIAEPPAPPTPEPSTVPGSPQPTAEPPAPSAAPPPVVEPPPTAEPETPAPPTAEPGSAAPSDEPAP